MSISNWSSYKGNWGKIYDVKWSKDDLWAHLGTCSYGELLETSSDGFNFMHVACAKGWQDVVEKLNELNSNMKHAKADSGVTPLHVAAHIKDDCHRSITTYLLKEGAYFDRN